MFSFCKKEEVVEKSRTELLTSKTWKLTGHIEFPGMDLNNNGVPVTDVYEYVYFADCMKNTLYYYYTDGKGEEISTCTNLNDSFEWKLSDDNTIIKYGRAQYSILELTETTFKIKEISPYYPYSTLTYTAQ